MSPAPPRILVLRLSALGDLVFALPALQALRHQFPQAHLAWLTEDRHAGLLRGHPEVDEVLVFPRSLWRGTRGLRRLPALGALADHLLTLRRGRPWDLVLDFQGNLKSALHLLFLPLERSVGFDRPVAREGAWRFLRERVPDPGRVHRSERDLALVRHLGYRGPIPQPAPWPLSRQAREAVDLRLGHELATPPRARPGGPVVLLHVEVSDYGRDKEWPQERWRELAAGLAAAAGARVLVLWTAASRRRALDFVQAAEGACELAPPTPDLEHLMALTDRASLLIGTDSGPVHLAALRGTRVLALFGPTDPLRYRPPGPRVEVLSALAEGQEPPPRDRSRRSPLMEALDTPRVLEAALGMLSTSS